MNKSSIINVKTLDINLISSCNKYFENPGESGRDKVGRSDFDMGLKMNILPEI